MNMNAAVCLAAAGLASVASADLVSYEYTGTHPGYVWTAFAGATVKMGFTIDTDTAASSMTTNRAEYHDAIVNGYFEIAGTRFNMADTPAINNIVVRTDVYDQNFGTYSNVYQVVFSSDGIARDGWSYPGNISFLLFDKDLTPDSVLDLGIHQPIETLRTVQNGGVDAISVGMGAQRGVFSTISSGDGGVVVVPAPGGVALLAAGGLLAGRRRR